MVAAIKPNVASQLTISIDSSIIRRDPLVVPMAPDTRDGAERTSVKKEPARQRDSPLAAERTNRRWERKPGEVLTLLHQCQGATRLFAKQEHQQHKGCEKDDDANRRVPVHAETMRISYSTIDASGCTCRRCPRLTIGAGFLCLRPMIDSRAEVRPKDSARKKDPLHAAGKGSIGRTQLSVTQN